MAEDWRYWHNNEDFLEGLGQLGPLNCSIGGRSKWASQFPLKTKGRFILNQHGQRFRLKGVNWYGASDANHVVGGLDTQRLDVICSTVRKLGFNVVRLPFSNEMLRSQVPPKAINFTLNPELQGLKPLEVFDQVIQCLGQHEVAVIVNNHTTYGEWCGPPSKNSLWFDPGTEYTESRWLDDWSAIAQRYSKCPHVIGYDLRNEIRPRWMYTPVWEGQRCSFTYAHDWAVASLQASKRVLKEVPGALIIVERIVWPQEGLMDYAKCPGPLLPELAGHLVLGCHHYAWSGPGRFLPQWAVPEGLAWADSAARMLGLVSARNYGDMEQLQLEKQIELEWGGVLKANLCPVWVSEFGVNATAAHEMRWLKDFVGLLEKHDADWAYWPLNVGPKPSCGSDESYGMLAPDWTPKTQGDERLDILVRAGLQSQGQTLKLLEATGDINVEQEGKDELRYNSLKPKWQLHQAQTVLDKGGVCSGGGGLLLSMLVAASNNQLKALSQPSLQAFAEEAESLAALPLFSKMLLTGAHGQSRSSPCMTNY